MAEFEQALLSNCVKVTVAQTAWKMTLERFIHIEGVMYICSLLGASWLCTDMCARTGLPKVSF